MAAWSSVAVKSPDRLASALAALHREDTLCDVEREKFLSAPGKQPFLRSWDAMAFNVTGHLGGNVVLPLSRLIVHHTLRLE